MGRVRPGGLTILIALAVFAGVSVVYSWDLPPWRDLEYRLYDRRLMAAAPPLTDEVVILGKDDAAVAAAGGDFTREHYAKALASLATCGPKAVGLDILFMKPGPPERSANFDQELALALKKVPAVAAARVDDNREQQLPFPPFEASARGLGFINIPAENDGVVRRAWGTFPASDGLKEGFALALARAARPDFPAQPRRYLIRYRDWAPGKNFLGLARFLGGEPPCAAVKDRFVLIGSWREVEHDQFATPPATLRPREQGSDLAADADGEGLRKNAHDYGVMIHAQALLTLLHNDAPLRPPAWGQALATLLGLAGLLLIHARWFKRPARLGLAALALLALWLAILWILGSAFALFMDLLYPLLALGGTGFALYYRAAAREGRRKREIESLFGRFVSASVAKRLIAREDGVPLGGRRKTISVMFSDVRGFTALSETLSAEAMSLQLTDYFTAMVEELFREEGTFDKFIGDALLAFWNDPEDQADHALRAVRCAVAMQKRLELVNRGFVAQDRPPLAIGIGIHTGEAVVGNQGSRIQFAYTAIGDTVNTASRLMGKALAGQVVVSAATANAIPNFDGEFPGAVATRFEVKGKAEPVPAFVIQVWEKPSGA